MMPQMVMMCRVEYTVINIIGYFHSRSIYVSSFSGLCYYYSCNSVIGILLYFGVLAPCFYAFQVIL